MSLSFFEVLSVVMFNFKIFNLFHFPYFLLEFDGGTYETVKCFMNFVLPIAIDFLWEIIPDLKDWVLLECPGVQLFILLVIENALVQKLIDLSKVVLNVVSDENGAFGVSANQMQKLEYFLFDHLVQTFH